MGTDVTALSLLMEVVMGMSLAAACGLRAFLPMLAIGICERTGYLTLGAHFHWLGSTPALIVFGVAVAIELVGDKVPAVDHALDVMGLVVKPVAGAILASAAITDVDPLLASVVGIITGGAMSAGVHVVKAKARVVSSAVTFGFANPFVSMVEDAFVALLTVLAILAPVIALGLVLVTGYVMTRVLRRIFFRRRRDTAIVVAA
ncbi:MAG: DUF4126 domain-containing protein [Acidobacteriota bacterium]